MKKIVSIILVCIAGILLVTAVTFKILCSISARKFGDNGENCLGTGFLIVTIAIALYLFMTVAIIAE